MKKIPNKYTSSPYFRSVSKNNSVDVMQNVNRKAHKYESLKNKEVIKKEQSSGNAVTTSQSTKILRKVPKQKLNEIDKRNILKSIGIDKPKKLHKYLK